LGAQAGGAGGELAFEEAAASAGQDRDRRGGARLAVLGGGAGRGLGWAGRGPGGAGLLPGCLCLAFGLAFGLADGAFRGAGGGDGLAPGGHGGFLGAGGKALGG
jgi:hypothetical protein